MIKLFFQETLKRWHSWPQWGRALAALVLCAVFFSSMRLGYLGPEMARMNRSIVPFQIPILDASAPSTSLQAELRRLEDGAEQKIGFGEPCKSGDTIRLVVSASHDGWLSFVGLSASGPYPLREEGFKPVVVVAGTEFGSDIKLDTEEGIEFLSAVHSVSPHDSGDLLSWLLPYAEVAEGIQSGKGGAPISVFGGLPPGVTGVTRYCMHQNPD